MIIIADLRPENHLADVALVLMIGPEFLRLQRLFFLEDCIAFIRRRRIGRRMADDRAMGVIDPGGAAHDDAPPDLGKKKQLTGKKQISEKTFRQILAHRPYLISASRTLFSKTISSCNLARSSFLSISLVS